ncbi:MAG TPA: CrcB family protein [Pseudolysinimonas sp.]|jgi:CrcB protein|nr:CrcB family protein [Pseudolysinimonas sp.]
MSGLLFAAVMVAGALGALLRYAVTRAFAGRPSRLPWAVLVVNVAGSLLAGVAIALGASAPLVPEIAVSGFAGGLTTFSTFSTETVQLVLEGRRRAATVSVLLNLVGGLGAFALAYAVTLAVTGAVAA